MVQRLEAIKGGGRSIKVGTTGTISALMTRELESVKSAPKTPVSQGTKHQAAVVSVYCKATSAKRPQLRKSLDGARSSSGSITSHQCCEGPQKTKDHKNHCQVPMLGARNPAVDVTPVRVKPGRRGPNIVEVVDIRCRNPETARASAMTKLKKLGFSKLSQSIM